MTRAAITVNGRAVDIDSAPPQETLQDFIRGRAALTGTAGACGHGVCGACTVLLDGQPVRSCLVLTRSTVGRDVVTVEGLELLEPKLARLLREAFLAGNAFQCGYCTSGMLMLTFWWLRTAPAEARTRADVEALLESNLCRCTGYVPLVETLVSLARASDGG
jgi:carbon-monoxide dehydrogenase small subunit